MENAYDQKKLQKYETEILDLFVKICEENNITYYLAYGTLIGAVRHKGFIPWDDDIDVCLKGEDYYKFRKIMQSHPLKGYFYQCLATEKYYFQWFSKIRKDNTIFLEEVLEGQKIHNGIYIDVFPLVPFPTKEKDQKKLYFKMKIFNLLTKSDMPKYKHYGKKGKILAKIFKIIPRNLRNKIALKITKSMILYNKDYKKYISLDSKDTYHIDSFDETTTVTFEGKKYLAPKNYDKFLTEIYGDYMKLPPVEERYNHKPIKVEFPKENK